MKKYLLLALFALSVSQANALTAAQPLTIVPNGSPLQFTGNLTYYGSTPYYIESSTPAATAVLLVSGSGFFYGVNCSSGAVGDNVQFFDSASASGITSSTQGKALTSPLYNLVSVSSNSAVSVSNLQNRFIPAGDSERYTHGIVGLKTGSNYYSCQIQALPDAVIQATPQTH